MAVARRIYLYLLAFAGLLTVLYAAASMLALIVARSTLEASTILGTGDLRARASLYLAQLVVGLPIWLGHWLVAQRAAARSAEERDAPERRLFLAAVFAVTAVVALFALHDLLRFVFTLPGATNRQRATLDGIAAGARLLVFGAAWFAYARLRDRTVPGERERREEDRAYDLAIYALSGFALAFLATGVGQAIQQLLDDLLRGSRPAVLAGSRRDTWTVWGAIAAWIVAGGAVWVPAWGYDLARGGRRDLRVFYLYLVLLVAAPVTLGSGAFGAYEVLRRLFGYRPSPVGYWDFLPGVLALVIVGGATWAYHWAIVRRQAVLGVTAAAAPPGAAEGQGDREGATGGIAWPRRPALALLALAGLAMAAPAFISLLWLGLDFLLGTGTSLSGSNWWRDRLSVSIAAGLVGAVAWLGPWSILQRAATASARERTADARRYLLGLIVLAGALSTIGFLIALLWLAFRTLFGDALGPSEVSRALKQLSSAVIAALLAGYHGLLLRRDLQLGGPLRRRVQAVALVAPGAEAALEGLRERSGLQIEVAGYLSDDGIGGGLDLATLGDSVAALGMDGRHDRALLILHQDGGSLYRYHK